MTTRTNAIARAAITALIAQVAICKKADLETLGLGTEILPGVKYRDLKDWLKENTGPVATVTVSEAKANTRAAKHNTALANAEKSATPKANPEAKAAEFTSAELRGSQLLVGRTKEIIKSVVKSPEGVRVAVCESGVRVPVVDIERNTRGNLRVAALGDKSPVATAKAVGKAIDKVVAKEAAPKAAEGRELVSRVSSNLISAIHNRDDKTLTVTFKSGAVWKYEGVGIREANAMAKAESHGQYFAANIKNAKDGKCIVRAPKVAAEAPAKTPAKAPATKPVAKVVAAAKPVAEEDELKATEVRGQTITNGRTKEVAAKVVRNKETGRREVVCESGARFPLALIVKGRGDKLKVAEVAAVVEAATAKGGAAKKPAATKPAAPAKAEPASTNRRATFSLPKVSDVRGHEVTVTKGSKETTVVIAKVVSRSEVRYALTANGFALPFDQIHFKDGSLVFTGKLTAAEFKAL